MGQLLYGAPSLAIEFEDRILAHLQLVITAKLRREEKFTLSWTESDGGRNSVWLHPAITLHFKYLGGAEPALSHPWVEALMVTANSNGGLRVTPEPPASVAG